MSSTTPDAAAADFVPNIVSNANNEDDVKSPGAANAQPAFDPSTQLTIRALVSTKEAGVIIGKGGANVAHLREETGVKAGVSKVVQGVHDRVLSVSGTLEGVAQVSCSYRNRQADRPRRIKACL